MINVHIPRTGTRLDPKSRAASYAQAAAFFAREFGTGPVIFVCHSWLLFPRHAELLQKGSNLYAFFSDYDIYESGLYEDYHEIWRLFDQNCPPDPGMLPQNTSLRRCYVGLMQRGEKTGWGKGVYVYHPTL